MICTIWYVLALHQISDFHLDYTVSFDLPSFRNLFPDCDYILSWRNMNSAIDLNHGSFHDTIESLRDTIVRFCHVTARSNCFKVARRNTILYKVVCSSSSCSFVVLAYYNNGTKSKSGASGWKISKKTVLTHTCRGEVLRQRGPKLSSISSLIDQNALISTYTPTDSGTDCAKQLQQMVRRDSGVSLSRWHAYSIVNSKKRMSTDSWLEQLQVLEDYFAKCKEADPEGTYEIRSTTQCEIVDRNKIPDAKEYKSSFVAWGATKTLWRNSKKK